MIDCVKRLGDGLPAAGCPGLNGDMVQNARLVPGIPGAGGRIR